MSTVRAKVDFTRVGSSVKVWWDDLEAAVHANVFEESELLQNPMAY